MVKPSFSYDQAATKIAAYGWADAATVPITYGFRASDASDPGFAQFSSALIDATVQAINVWSDVANIKFQRVGSGNSGYTAYTNDATILFAGDTDSGGYGWTYFPGDRASSSVDGNVFLNTSYGNFVDLSAGSYEFLALIHEIGHGLGLDHPGAYNGGSPTYAVDAVYPLEFASATAGARKGDFRVQVEPPFRSRHRRLPATVGSLVDDVERTL